MLKVHVSTLRRWTRAGRLPSVRITDGTLRYRCEDVQQLVAGSLRWEAAPARKPRPIQSAPSWLDGNAIHPITGLRYADPISGGGR